jgi:trigger factor
MAQMLSQDGALRDLKDSWQPAVEKSLHSRLIVEAIIKEQNIEASEEDIDKELENIAAEEGMSLEDVTERYGKGRALDYIKDDIMERKLFDLLLAENTIITRLQANYLDLMANYG